MDLREALKMRESRSACSADEAITVVCAGGATTECARGGFHRAAVELADAADATADAVVVLGATVVFLSVFFS